MAKVTRACKPLTDAQQVRALEGFVGKHKDRNRALFALGLYSGFRISELLSLRVKDVYDGHQIRDKITVHAENMKFGKNEEHKAEPRTVITNPECVEYLLPICKDRDKNDWLFRSQKPDKYGRHRVSRNHAWLVYRGAYEAAGIPRSSHGYGTHSTRKSFAEFQYQYFGKDLVKVQGMMGHKRIDSTVKYLNKGAEEQKAAFVAPRLKKRKLDDI
jgi:integrase